MRFKFHALRPRIYVIIRGGLGNQLHQIAAAIAFSEIIGGQVRIFNHIVENSVDPTRRAFYKYLNLEVVFPNANFKEVGAFEQLIIRTFSKFSFLGMNSCVLKEESWESMGRNKPIYLLQGWFQSPRYLPQNFNPELLFDGVLDKSGCNIHVRLTDFATIDSNPLGKDYYSAAINIVETFPRQFQYRGYSDDIDQAKDILSLDNRIYFPEINGTLLPHKLLEQLSSSGVLVCSRSSLSWWAAQVVHAKGGIIISPWKPEMNEESWHSLFIASS